MVTEDPVVYYNYSIIGTFTVKLNVVAEWEQARLDATKGIVQKTGDFSTSLKLQGGLPSPRALDPARQGGRGTPDQQRPQLRCSGCLLGPVVL